MKNTVTTTDGTHIEIGADSSLFVFHTERSHPQRYTSNNAGNDKLPRSPCQTDPEEG
eukprot:CAMPEP_0185918660 /NCGR_PEP_ID=MMETSP0924C-20121207/5992_1 /TAXON_ID=321610 /ORGANISM="Perkinsus chesapeaki, Strain ATCC PRA-65" /LENGTH=56 /DNA_ID=CAMNT_0028646603 /DNA_START=31 /DNA_END=201 /DNA_ORIENTATION=-